MKKLLVVLLAAMMVLSLAAVSMAAPSVSGDFRLNFTNKTNETSQKAVVDQYDFRLAIKGQVSDNIDAYGRLRCKDGVTNYDEYTFTFKQSFGTITAGKWEWVITPSRKNLSSNYNVDDVAGIYMMPKTTSTLAIDVPFESGLYAGLAYVIDGDQTGDQNVYDGAYGLKVGYKTDVFGVQVGMLDYNYNKRTGDNDYDNCMAIDAWYQIIDSIKVYTYAVDAEKNKNVDPDIDPIIGAAFTNIAGSKVSVWAEYALDKEWRSDKDNAATERDFNPYFLTVAIPISGGFSTEIEYNNFKKGTKEEEKLLVRGKFKF